MGGLESPGNVSAGITQGLYNGGGAHIVYIDGAHLVDIQVATTDTIRIHNLDNGVTRAGNVTLVW